MQGTLPETYTCFMACALSAFILYDVAVEIHHWLFTVKVTLETAIEQHVRTSTFTVGASHLP